MAEKYADVLRAFYEGKQSFYYILKIFVHIVIDIFGFTVFSYVVFYLSLCILIC